MFACPGSPNFVCHLLGEGGVELAAAEEPCAREGEQDAYAESDPGEDAADYGARAESDDCARGGEEQDEADRDGATDEERLADVCKE